MQHGNGLNQFLVIQIIFCVGFVIRRIREAFLGLSNTWLAAM
jgi:hypothetical protein